MGLTRQKYWSGFLYPPPGDLPNQGIEPRSPALQMDSLPSKPSHNHLFYTNMQFGCLVFKILLQYSPNYLLTAAAKSFHSCLTLCDPIDGSPPGYRIPRVLQARTLEWVAISFSKAWKWKVKVKSFSRVQLLATPWTAAHQAPPSMGFSSQEYWSGVPLPSPTYLLRQCMSLLDIIYLCFAS